MAAQGRAKTIPEPASAARRRFVFTSTCRFNRVRRVWSRLWSFQVEDAVTAASEAASYELTQSRHGLWCARMSPIGGGNVGWVRLVSCGVK
jgi:hypothetical protein